MKTSESKLQSFFNKKDEDYINPVRVSAILFKG